MADKHCNHNAAYSGAGMANKKERPVEPPQLVELPEDCRMAALPALQTQVSAALRQPGFTVAAATVTRIDTAALQWLVACRRAATASGCAMHWQGVNEVVRDAAALLGLTQVLELPAPMPA